MEAIQITKARDLVRRIEDLGGPPPHRAATFHAISTALHRSELGFPFLIPLAMLASGAVVGWLTATLWETGATFTEETKKVMQTASRAGRFLIWGGVAWLGWKAVQAGR